MADAILSGQQEVTNNITNNSYPTYNTTVNVNGSSGFIIPAASADESDIIFKLTEAAEALIIANSYITSTIIKGSDTGGTANHNSQYGRTYFSGDGKTITHKYYSGFKYYPVIIIPIFSS